LTIQTPLRLLSAGLCENAEILDDGQLLVVGAPRVYRIAPDAGSFELAPLSAFLVFTNCDPGDFLLRWRLVSPAGALLHTQSQAQMLSWSLETRTYCAAVNINGLISAGHGLRAGVYELEFDLAGRPLTRLAFLVEARDEP
jgi:hypothetical protein